MFKLKEENAELSGKCICNFHRIEGLISHFGDAQRNYIHKRNEMLACHDADVRAQSRFAVHFEGAK